MKPKMGRRYQVLETLRGSHEPKTVSEIARKLRVHGNTVRFHLDSLLTDGLIEVEEAHEGERPVGRPAVRYRAVARVVPSQMRHTETLVKLFLGDLVADPRGGVRAEEIGRRWGSEQAESMRAPAVPASSDPDVVALNKLLNNMGFESDEPTKNEICVKSCPFLDDAQLKEIQAKEGSEALHPVCAVHLGVMKGALSTWEAGVEVAELKPFARVDRCRISLARHK